MIAQIIDVVICLLVSFIFAFISYKLSHKLMTKTEIKQDNNAILERRIKILSKQQDDLLESASERVSTFLKVQNEEFGQTEGASDSMYDRIRRIMKNAGITDMNTSTFITLCSIGGIAFAAFILYFEFLNFITGIPIGFSVGAYLVYNFLASRAEARRMEFLQQLPDAIDMMIRGVKAGLNMDRVVKLVSIEARPPISEEYLTISQKFDLGVEPEKVLVEAADRVNLEEFRFLVVALILQIENGGVLGEILQNLSGIVRKRLELGLKMKAMSAEARMSAIVISALPFVFAGIMALVNPNHIQEFTKPGTGQTLLKIALTLFSLGTFFMLKATKLKV
ncbi:MAG: type II secretion system F family protein [Alphaproteobacteria bacterium]|nr:type II secretion system F family protein [Alphaproteobacteria bacterium]